VEWLKALSSNPRTTPKKKKLKHFCRTLKVFCALGTVLAVYVCPIEEWVGAQLRKALNAMLINEVSHEKSESLILHPLLVALNIQAALIRYGLFIFYPRIPHGVYSIN
jgi:hypothetical protein